MSWRFVIKWCLSLLFSVMKHGVHLYSILDAQTRINKNKTALIIDGVEVSFQDLKHRTDQLICEWIKPEYQSQFPNQLALILEQDLDSLAALFALSRLGKDIVIINPNLIEHKLQTLLDHKNFYLIGHLARLKKLKFSIIQIFHHNTTHNIFISNAIFLTKLVSVPQGLRVFLK